MPAAPGQQGPPQIGPGQPGPAQVRAGQVGPAQVGAVEAGAGEAGAPQQGARQVGPDQPGVRQIGVGEVDAREVAVGEVLAGQPGAPQVGVGRDPEPVADPDGVGAGRVVHSAPRCVEDVTHPPGALLVVGEVAEELDRELAEGACEEQGVLSAGELACGFPRHQPFDDGAVDELEDAVVAADQQAARADRLGALGRGKRGLGEFAEGGGHGFGELVEPQGAAAALPQPPGQRGHRRPQLVDGQSGRGAGPSLAAQLLVVEPGGEHVLVQAGRAEGTAGSGDGPQLVLAQVGDEGEQPGIAAEHQQVGDVAQELVALVGRALVAVAAHQVGADLRRGEAFDGQDPALRQQSDALAERGEDLGVRLEVLGAAADHDLGVVDGGVEEDLQVIGGPVVADAVDQFVEAVEKQDDAALGEHVTQGAQVDGVDVVAGQVGGDQPFEAVRPVECVERDQQRCQVRELFGDTAGELAQGEGLAVSEVAEEQDEPSVIGLQEFQQLLDETVVLLAVGAVGVAVALGQVEAGGVLFAAAQPGGLGGHVAAEVEQALELDEAAHTDPHAVAGGPAPQPAGRGVARVHQDGLGAGVGRVHLGDEAVEFLFGGGTGVDGDALLPDDAVLLFLPGGHDLRHVARFAARDVAQPYALPAHPADLLHPLGERCGRLLQGRPALGALDGDDGRQFGDGEDPPGLPPCSGETFARGGDPVVPAGDAVRGDLEQLEPGGGGGAEQVQPRGGQPGEGVGVLQPAGTADRVARAAAVGERVAQGADAQPALLLVPAHGLGEPGGLVASDESVLFLGAVAVGHGGVESGDDRAQFGHGEEGPGLIAVEDGVQALIEAAEEPGVVAPLGPVRRLRRHFVGLAGVEVRQGRGLVHVLRARHHHHPLGGQVELGP